MSYRARTTTYGEKTTAEISALTGMSQGDTVFNKEYGMVEWYTGNTWVSNASCTIVAARSISEGQCVSINSAGRAVLLDTTAATTEYGVGVCQYGGGTGTTISVRQHGLAKCLAAASLTNGQYATRSSTPGSITQTTSPSIGALGRIVQGATSGNLAWVFLSFIERA